MLISVICLLTRSAPEPPSISHLSGEQVMQCDLGGESHSERQLTPAQVISISFFGFCLLVKFIYVFSGT